MSKRATSEPSALNAANNCDSFKDDGRQRSCSLQDENIIPWNNDYELCNRAYWMRTRFAHSKKAIEEQTNDNSVSGNENGTGQASGCCCFSDMPDCQGQINVIRARTEANRQRFSAFVRMALYLCDMGSDWYLGVSFLANGRYIWAGLTVIFIAIPQFIVTFRSLIFYKDIMDFHSPYPDSFESSASDTTAVNVPLLPFLKQIPACILIAHACQMGPVIRCYQYLRHRGSHTALSVRRTTVPEKERRNYLFWKNCNKITKRLCLLESFMEALPQITLQTYILTKQDLIHTLFAPSHAAQLVSICFSIISVAFGLGFTRLSSWKLRGLRWKRIAIKTTHLLGRCTTLTVRIVVLVLFANQFRAYVFLAFALHSVVIIGALYWDCFPRWNYYELMLAHQVDATFDRRRFTSSGYGWEMAWIKIIMWIFYPWTTFFDCFADLRDRDSEGSLCCSVWRRRDKLFLVCYGLLFVENEIMLALWAIHADMAFSVNLLIIVVLTVGYCWGVGITGVYIHKSKSDSSFTPSGQELPVLQHFVH